MSRITLYWKLDVQSIFIQPEYSNVLREREKEREREREERDFVDLRNVSQRRKPLFSTRINNRSSGYMKTRRIAEQSRGIKRNKRIDRGNSRRT